MSEKQDDSHSPPPRFLRALKISLVIQIIFNALLITFEILWMFHTMAGFCCYLFWGFVGPFSLFFLIDVCKYGVNLGRDIRNLAYAVYLVQFGICLISGIVFLGTVAIAQGPLCIATLGLVLALGTLITLLRFDRANPLPKDSPKPPIAPPEPEDIETSGDWDEAKNSKPKP